MDNSRQLAELDLNLLVALRALLREEHVSRAAKAVGMSQPAMSRALGRLRTMFGDELLVRSGRGMMRTLRGATLLPELEGVLGAVSELVAPPRFEPATAEGEVRLAVPDIVVHMLGARLQARMRAVAPRLSLSFLPWSSAWHDQLEDGAVDLTIGAPAGHEAGIYSRPLLRNHWVCALRCGHPALRRRWDRRAYAAQDHLVVALTGQGPSSVDEALARHGLTRRIAMRVPYATLTPLLVAETDLVLTTAWWLADALNRNGELALKRLPIALPPIDLPLVWHERAHRDPQQRWLRDLLVDVASEVATCPPARLRG